MKFNAYIVELKHRDASLTGNFRIGDEIVSANFRRLAKDLFVAQFKIQVEFTFLQQMSFNNRDKDILILLPVISKFNKRKLTKLSKILTIPEQRDKYNILSHLVHIDKIVKVDELLHFFSMKRKEAIDFLVQMEVREEIKMIELSRLTITSYENFQEYYQQMHDLFTDFNTGSNRSESLKYIDIETKIKLPQSFLFFKYLIHLLSKSFTFRIRKDRVAFQKVVLSDNESGALTEINRILSENKLSIFSIDNILKLSERLIFKEIHDTLSFLVEKGEVVRLNDKFFIYSEDLNKIINKLKKYKRNQGETIDIKDFRELTLYSRRYLIMLFEYFDNEKITRRVENHRQILIGT